MAASTDMILNPKTTSLFLKYTSSRSVVMEAKAIIRSGMECLKSSGVIIKISKLF